MVVHHELVPFVKHAGALARCGLAERGKGGGGVRDGGVNICFGKLRAGANKFARGRVCRNSIRRGRCILGERRAMDFEGLARLCFDPFAIDVGDVLLEEGWVVELVIIVSGERKAKRKACVQVECFG